MRPQRTIATATLPLLAGLAVLGGGCGSDSGSAPSAPAKPVRESSDPLPKLERGWSERRSHGGGFAYGLPPGWSDRPRANAVTIISPDELVALTVSAYRGASSLTIPPRQYVSRVYAALPGYRRRSDGSRPRPFEARYRAVAVSGRAVAKRSGVPQQLRVIVLRRPGRVTFTAAIAANARRAPWAERRQALAIVRTVRSRPRR